MDTDSAERLAEYARAYVQHFNEIYSRFRGRDRVLDQYCIPVKHSSIFECSDGILILYSTMDPTPEHPSGVYLYDRSKETLTHLLQSKTDNLVKVLNPPSEPILRPYSPDSRTLPPDLPRDEVQRNALNIDLLKLMNRGKVQVQGMAISPTWEVHNGLLTSIRPTRAHIFSPTVLSSNDQFALQFTWMFAEVLWEADRLPLTVEDAYRNAEADLNVLRIGIAAGIPPVTLAEDKFEAVAVHMESACNEFEALIDNPDVLEPAVQDFLEQPGHMFIVSPIYSEIFPRRSIGGERFVPDFIVLKPDDDYHFIEIENPRVRIYRERGQEQAAHLTHAITQVEDWLRYVDENRDSVRREDGLHGINRPTGEVIAGRDAHLGKLARRRFEYSRTQSSITLRTYDMLIQDARAYAATIRRMKSGT